MTGQQDADGVERFVAFAPEDTFRFGEQVADLVSGGGTVLLYGGLGAGKTLLAKGLISGLGVDPDDITSPSFALVNLYKTPTLDIYHIALWRLDGDPDPAAAVGLDEILENEPSLAVIEWADRLPAAPEFTVSIAIAGAGDEPRRIEMRRSETEKR